MKTVVFCLKTDTDTKYYCPEGFYDVDQIKLLMVAMGLTSSEYNFAHSYIG